MLLRFVLPLSDCRQNTLHQIYAHVSNKNRQRSLAHVYWLIPFYILLAYILAVKLEHEISDYFVKVAANLRH